MDQALLETLVKLAAAGTSGVCIVCVVASAYILLKMTDDAPPQKYSTLKTFMVLAFLIALVSAGTTITAGYWDYKTKVALKQKNEALNQNNIRLAKITEEQKQRLKQSESELVAAYETVERYKVAAKMAERYKEKKAMEGC